MSVRDARGEMTEEPPNTDGPARNFLTVGEPMQAYREVAQAVIASAVTDLVKGRARAEEAYQFLCGASDDNRAMLEFWCFVAGYSPALVVSTTRARSMCAWRVWWLAQGKHRLQQIGPFGADASSVCVSESLYRAHGDGRRARWMAACPVQRGLNSEPRTPRDSQVRSRGVERVADRALGDLGIS